MSFERRVVRKRENGVSSKSEDEEQNEYFDFSRLTRFLINDEQGCQIRPNLVCCFR